MLLPATATANERIFYVSGSFGLAGSKDTQTSNQERYGAIHWSGEYELDKNISSALAIGGHLSENVRAEFEFSRRKNDIANFLSPVLTYSPNTNSSRSAAFTSVLGNLESTGSLINLYYDFMPHGKISPYVSAGVGYVRMQGDVVIYFDNPPGTTVPLNMTVDESNFAYQLGIGATFSTPNLNTKLITGYRFIRANTMISNEQTSYKYNINEYFVGVRYNFSTDALAAAPTDYIATPDYYVSASYGITNPEDAQTRAAGINNTNYGAHYDIGKAVLDNANNFAIAVGTSLTEQLRTEIELSRRKVAAKHYLRANPGAINAINPLPFEFHTHPLTGDATTTALLANAYYVFDQGQRLKPYISAGAGIVDLDVDLRSNATTSVLKNSKKVLGYQVGLGLAYQATDNIELFSGYRFFGSSKAKFAENKEFEHNAHEVNMGVRYHF